MKKLLLTFTLLLSLITAMAQDRYIIFLKDKANSPFSINNPSEYLSARAIARRTRMNIPIDSLDIPVNPGAENRCPSSATTLSDHLYNINPLPPNYQFNRFNNVKLNIQNAISLSTSFILSFTECSISANVKFL